MSMRGKVRWFRTDKGYGFLIPDDGSKDVFLHAKELTRCGIDPMSVKVDQPMTFNVSQGQKGHFATDVKIA